MFNVYVKIGFGISQQWFMYHKTKPNNLKCKVYPHKKLISKEVIRNNELSLAIPKEIKTALGMQGVTDYKRITIWRDGKELQTALGKQEVTDYKKITIGRVEKKYKLKNIQTFRKSIIYKEIKIGYFLDTVEQYTPAPFKGLLMSKIWTWQGQLLEVSDMWKVWPNDPDHMKEDC